MQVLKYIVHAYSGVLHYGTDENLYFNYQIKT